MYYPATNLKGDIVAIYNKTGNCIVRYEYDAWGNVIDVVDNSGINLAEINPIRYRGYYYDTETKLYYLQSRYYNPDVGRFLNSDSISDSGAGVLGYNTFIYCANNPVNALDPSGHLIISAILIGAAVGAVTSALAEFGCQLLDKKINNTPIDGGDIIRAGVIGGICGALSGGIGGAIAKTGVSAITKGVANVIADGCMNVVETSFNAICDKETLGVGDYVYSFASGVASSGIGSLASCLKQNSNMKLFKALSNNNKKITLNTLSDGQHITRKMINNGDYLSTSAYKSYIAYGSDAIQNVTGSAATISFELFGNEFV